MTSAVTSRTRPPAASLIGWLSVLGTIGTALLSIGHLGLEIPVLSALGPEGTRAIPAAAAGFGVAALLYLVVAVGAFRQASWAWAVGLVVNLLAVAAGLSNVRGAASVIGIVISALILILLLSPGGRKALRRPR